MPDSNNKPLPPLSNEAFDGEKESIELKFNRCSHKDVKIDVNRLICKCGAGWEGPNIIKLYEAFKAQ